MKPMRERFARSRRPALVLAAGLLLVALLSSLGARWSIERRDLEISRAITGGDPARAPELLRRFGCVGCHKIPGIGGADGEVAPSLEGLRKRVFIGGVLRNTPENLVRWIVDPRSLSPHSAMPATGIDEQGARDIAAYLYAH